MPVKHPGGPKVPEDAGSSAGFAALVLAAGAGRRFGGSKLTAPFRGGVLLDGALAAAFGAPAEAVILVTGADAGVAPAAERFARRNGVLDRMSQVHAPDWDEGLAASLRAGLAQLGPHIQAAFIFLGDMPDSPPGLATRMAEAWGPGVAAVAPVLDGEPGHPALLGAELFPAAMRLTGDRGARALMEAQGSRFVRLPVQAQGVVFDVDTQAALARAGGG